MRVLSREESQYIDAHIPSEIGISLEVLMENAGRTVADEVMSHYEYGVVLLVAGPGNNGADALVAARHLAERYITCVVWEIPSQKPCTALYELQRKRLESCGVLFIEDPSDVYDCEEPVTVVVEGIMGTGFHGSLRAELVDVLEMLRGFQDQGSLLISIDVPAGMDATTGQVDPHTIAADVTVTFHAPKQGMYLYPAKSYVGDIVVGTLGIPSGYTGESARTLIREAADMVAMFPMRPPVGHKGTFGHVLIVGGSPGMIGAPVLAAEAAAYMGAGKTTLATSPACLTAMQSKLTPDIMTASYETADDILRSMESRDILAIGPGLGRGEAQTQLVAQIIQEYAGPLVCDADALIALSHVPGWKEMPKAIPWILTPHPGEFAALTGVTPERLELDRIGFARQFARDTHTILVLKGAPTVIADPWGTVVINATGNVGMAIGGMGDILTGAIASLWGQYTDKTMPRVPAEVATYLHGAAADVLRQSKPCGIRPLEVAAQMPRCMCEAMRE